MNWIIVIVFGIIVICVSHWLEGKIDSSLCMLAVEVISIIAIVTAVVGILVSVVETPQSIKNFNPPKALNQMK